MTALTRGISPLKVYEYLACGLPVVATALPALEDRPGAVHVEPDAEAFRARVLALLEEDDPVLVEGRRRLAARHDWSARGSGAARAGGRAPARGRARASRRADGEAGRGVPLRRARRRRGVPDDPLRRARGPRPRAGRSSAGCRGGRAPGCRSARWTWAASGAAATSCAARRACPASAGASTGPWRTCGADCFHLQYKREQVGFTRALARRAPVVWTEHGRFPGGWKGAVLAAGYRAAARHVSAIVCVSEQVAEDVRRAVGPGPRVEVVENAVDTTTARPPTAQERALARQSIGLSDERPVLLWVGRLEQPKRPLAALELAERWPGATVLAGDGSMRAQVEARARDQRDTRVLGFVPDVDRLYRAADVMAFTSDGAEGYPTVLVEAGAHGVPVVGDERCGAAPALRDMGCDPLPADAGPQAWVDALLAAMTPARSQEVRRYAERHDVRAWVDRHEQILASVVAGRVVTVPALAARARPLLQQGRGMLAYAAAPAVGLATGPVLARMLGTEGRGELAILLQPLTVAGAVAALGVPAAVTHFLAGGHPSAPTMRRARLVTTLSSLVVYLLLVGYALVVEARTGMSAGLLSVAWSWVFVEVWVSLRRARAQGEGPLWRLDAERAVYASLRLLAVVGCAWLGLRSVEAYAAATLLPVLLGSLLVLGAAGRSVTAPGLPAARGPASAPRPASCGTRGPRRRGRSP